MDKLTIQKHRPNYPSSQRAKLAESQGGTVHKEDAQFVHRIVKRTQYLKKRLVSVLVSVGKGASKEIE